MERILHELVQESPEWHQFRLDHDGASEAAAMLGLSKTTTRTELLRAKSTGIAKEFSEWVQEHILDHGHEVEALARPMAEEILGEELYPQVWSFGKPSASTDGLTMIGDTAFEHKQWEETLAAAVARGELPDEHQPQCQQTMMVTGAERVLFMVSNGTPEKCVHMFVKPHGKWMERIKAGWAMFHQDLDHYQPQEVLPPVTAAPVMALPALSIQVNGAITLTDNLAVFGDGLRAFIERIPEKPSTDQQFADCKEACKKLQEAQDALDAGEAHALGQISSFDQMRRTKALLFDLARNTRLAVEKLVAAREQQIKVDIVAKAKAAYAAHLAGLTTRLGKPYLPAIPENFAGVIKNKRTIASLQDACDTELARVKIESSAAADRVQINLNSLRELAKDHPLLFADAAQLVLKDNSDLVLLINARISEHQQAEAKRLEAEREKIRQEEQAKAQREAEAKVAVERKAEEDAADAKTRQDRADQEAEDRRIAAALAAEEARLQADRRKQDDLRRQADEREAESRRAVEAERQATLDIEQTIAGLYERIKDIKKYSALAKACAACIERVQKRVA